MLKKTNFLVTTVLTVSLFCQRLQEPQPIHKAAQAPYPKIQTWALSHCCLTPTQLAPTSQTVKVRRWNHMLLLDCSHTMTHQLRVYRLQLITTTTKVPSPPTPQQAFPLSPFIFFGKKIKPEKSLIMNLNFKFSFISTNFKIFSLI